jgi:hypothetical protein
VWGGRFADMPHVNWPGYTTANDLYPLDSLWRASTALPVLQRLRKAWDYVDMMAPLDKGGK